MPRPRRPHWDAHTRNFRTRIDGKYIRFPKSIGSFDRPLIDGVPQAAWNYLAELGKRHEGLVVANKSPMESLPKATDHGAASGRAVDDPSVTLLLMHRDETSDGFAYADLERLRLTPATNGHDDVLILRFARSAVVDVRLTGRNLAALPDDLGRRRTPCLRETIPSVPSNDDAEPIITGILISRMSERWIDRGRNAAESS